jgi:DNA-binding FadR family transcriptional regulator
MEQDHQALLAAFSAHDPDAARVTMIRHFTDGADLLVKHLDDLKIWG